MKRNKKTHDFVRKRRSLQNDLSEMNQEQVLLVVLVVPQEMDLDRHSKPNMKTFQCVMGCGVVKFQKNLCENMD